MKLLFCPSCADVVRLERYERHCNCGMVSGRYEADGHHATVSSQALVIGLDNNDLRAAIHAGHTKINAWLMTPANAPRVRWRSTDEAIPV